MCKLGDRAGGFNPALTAVAGPGSNPFAADGHCLLGHHFNKDAERGVCRRHPAQ